jgi:hypothetical protein
MHSIDMRKRIVLVAVAILAVAAILLVAYRDRPALSVTFVGRESGPAYRAAGFDVKNAGPVSIFIEDIQVQVRTSGDWKTVSETY